MRLGSHRNPEISVAATALSVRRLFSAAVLISRVLVWSRKGHMCVNKLFTVSASVSNHRDIRISYDDTASIIIMTLASNKSRCSATKKKSCFLGTTPDVEDA